MAAAAAGTRGARFGACRKRRARLGAKCGPTRQAAAGGGAAAGGIG